MKQMAKNIETVWKKEREKLQILWYDYINSENEMLLYGEYSVWNSYMD